MEIRKSSISLQLLLAVLLLLVGAAFRLLPHVPNFAPIGAIALFGGAVLSWRLALWLPLSLMIVSDLLLGFYPGIGFTWAGFLLVATFGMALRRTRLLPRIVVGGMASGIIFFVVSNFGVWLTSGMYSTTLEGLIQCYGMALPFFRMSLMADLFYSAILFSVYEAVLYFAKAHKARQAISPAS